MTLSLVFFFPQVMTFRWTFLYKMFYHIERLILLWSHEFTKASKTKHYKSKVEFTWMMRRVQACPTAVWKSFTCSLNWYLALWHHRPIECLLGQGLFLSPSTWAAEAHQASWWCDTSPLPSAVEQGAQLVSRRQWQWTDKAFSAAEGPRPSGLWLGTHQPTAYLSEERLWWNRGRDWAIWHGW